MSNGAGLLCIAWTMQDKDSTVNKSYCARGDLDTTWKKDVHCHAQQEDIPM